jgi:hypothetical protein
MLSIRDRSQGANHKVLKISFSQYYVDNFKLLFGFTDGNGAEASSAHLPRVEDLN